MLESLPVHEGIKIMNSAAGKKDTECWGEVGLLSSIFYHLISMTINTEVHQKNKLQILLKMK